MMNMSRLILTVSALLLAGCATTDPSRVEADFGNSVRQMTSAQILDPAAAQNPPTELPSGLDPGNAEAVLGVYREHVGDPEEVEKAFEIDAND